MSEYRSGYINSYALVVGINTYSDRRFMPLGQAESDAQSLADMLGAPPYNFQITRLLGAEATKSAILRALHQLRRAEADARVLVYFAGHGYTLSDRLGNETGYLACADTVPDEDFTALELQNVIDLTRHTEAKHIGFIFDACFSGQALGLTRAPSVTADKLMQRRAYQVISAGAGDQTVSDYQSMTGRLIEALNSGILMSDGLVTLGELGLHVQQTITADSYQTQIPQFGHIRGSQGGDFVLYVDTSVRLPAELEDVLRSSRPTVRLSGVVELVEIAHAGEDELGLIARERLASIMETDPDAHVREAAQSYFVELEEEQRAQDVIREAERLAGEARGKAEAARRARDITPKGMRKPPQEVVSAALVSEPEPAPASAPVMEAPPSMPVVSVSKTVEVSPPASKAAPRAAKSSLPLPLPVILGIGGVIALLIVGAIALNGLGGRNADNDNDSSPDTPASSIIISDDPQTWFPDLNVPEELTFDGEENPPGDENAGYAARYYPPGGYCNSRTFRDLYVAIALFDNAEDARQSYQQILANDAKTVTIDRTEDVSLGEEATSVWFNLDGSCDGQNTVIVRYNTITFIRYNAVAQVVLGVNNSSMSDASMSLSSKPMAQQLDTAIMEHAED